MKSTKGIRFAAFCRVSTREQAVTGESLQTQEKRLREIVERLEGVFETVVAVPEHATPGREHAALVGLMNEAERGAFDALIVADSTRFSRDPEFAYPARQTLRKAKIRLFYGSAEQDLNTAEGEAMAAMAAVFDQYTVAKLLDQASATRLSRAERGWPHSKDLPFARLIMNATASRTGADAVWGLDEAKHALVQRMYDLYVGDGLTFADVGRQLSMNPETIRRILVKQSGATWLRRFHDRRAAEVVVVSTEIPRLLSEDQIAQVRVRAALNQVARAKWVRKREYVLSGFVRCWNEDCGCSNLSGHQSLGNRKRPPGRVRDGAEPRTYPYYAHRLTGRHATCLRLVPAAALENSVIGQLSQLLSDGELFREAVLAAGPVEAAAVEALIIHRAKIERELAAAHKVQERALAGLLDVETSSFNEKVLAAVRHADGQILSLTEDLQKIKQRIDEVRVVEPANADEIMDQLKFLNGRAALQWPPHLQRQLLEIFFGPRSTRHLRDGVGIRSTSVGIFVKRCWDERAGSHYFSYVARGRLGLTVTGHLTDFEDLDLRLKDWAEIDPRSQAQELEPLVKGLQALKGSPWFRESRPAFIRAKS